MVLGGAGHRPHMLDIAVDANGKDALSNRALTCLMTGYCLTGQIANHSIGYCRLL